LPAAGVVVLMRLVVPVLIMVPFLYNVSVAPRSPSVCVQFMVSVVPYVVVVLGVIVTLIVGVALLTVYVSVCDVLVLPSVSFAVQL
jgi:hypothetical protein